jgi:hypothetical protein
MSVGDARSYTRGTPYDRRGDALVIALFFVCLGLVFVAKFALPGVRALDRRRVWIVDLRSWRAIVYNTLLVLALAATADLRVLVGGTAAGPDSTPLVGFAMIFLVGVVAVGANTIVCERGSGRPARQ